jgi:hypothetical protein
LGVFEGLLFSSTSIDDGNNGIPLPLFSLTKRLTLFMIAGHETQTIPSSPLVIMGISH